MKPLKEKKMDDQLYKELFENLLSKTNGHQAELETLGNVVNHMIEFLDTKFGEEFEQFGLSLLEEGAELEEENSQELSVNGEEMSSEENIEHSIPFNVVHLKDGKGGGYYNDIRNCLCTPFECPFYGEDCQFVQVSVRDRDEKNED